MATKIQLRRDTEAQWIANNPTLSAGEVALSLDINKIKFGDGTKSWTQLDYVSGTTDEITEGSNNLFFTNKRAQDAAGEMVTGNTESGISVTYDEETGKLNFDVNDPTITLSGDVTGTATMTNLGNVTITTTVAADSVALGTDTTGDYVASVSGNDGVSVSGAGEGASVTVANTDKGSSQNIFKNVAVSGQSTIVADSNDDTLTVVAGTGITLTTNATTDTLTVSNDGVTTVNGSSGAITNVALTTGKLSQFSATTSSELAGVVSDETGTGALVFANSPTFSGTVNAESLTISGNLTVNGSTTTINSTTLTVDDKNIELGSVAAPTDTTADGGGITLKGSTDKTFNWVDATDAWTSSEHLDLANGKVIKINGTQVLSATEFTGNAATVTNGVVTTGSYSDPSWITSLAASKVGLENVENVALSTWAGSSSITTLGTVSTGTWSATNIALDKGGTNSSLTAVQGGVVYSTSTAMAITSAGNAGEVLISSGTGAPTWGQVSGESFHPFMLSGM
jgi:hypothetical protein